MGRLNYEGGLCAGLMMSSLHHGIMAHVLRIDMDGYVNEVRGEEEVALWTLSPALSTE